MFEVRTRATATWEDLQTAVRNPRTVAIFWNSHGTFSGQLVDCNLTAPPFDSFALGGCMGQLVKETYQIPAGIRIIYWENTVTAAPILIYYQSDRFDRDLDRITPPSLCTGILRP